MADLENDSPCSYKKKCLPIDFYLALPFFDRDIGMPKLY